jgi:hypothetical protein
MKYIDLIETDNWKIVSENGSIENILIPVFGHDNTIELEVELFYLIFMFFSFNSSLIFT